MERAASKRLLVENRKNPISFDDFVGGMIALGSAGAGHVGPLIGAATNVISKSPLSAKGLYSTGKALEQAATKKYSLSDMVKKGNERGSVGVIADYTNPKTGEVNFKLGNVTLREIPTRNSIHKEAIINHGYYSEMVSMQDPRLREAQIALGKLKYGDAGNTGLKMLAGTAAGGVGAMTIAGMANRKKRK
jgi:hypothetical protein